MKRILVFLLLFALLLSGCVSQEELDQAVAEAREAGYNEGYSVGYDEGYGIGYDEGEGQSALQSYEEGKADGYETGRESGYNLGYEDGYDDGRYGERRYYHTYSQPQQTQSVSATVYVTDTGSKYHSYGCQYLSQSCNSISLSSAKASGYAACSKCSPPR